MPVIIKWVLAYIMQEGVQVAYSRKLDDTQKNYTTIEKECLSVVCVLEEYKTMLLGAPLDVYTGHRNLTFDNLNSQQIMRWKFLGRDWSQFSLHSWI